MCLTVNAYKLDTNDDFEKMSPKEQKNIFVDKRGTKLKPQKRQNIDDLLLENYYNYYSAFSPFLYSLGVLPSVRLR